MQSKLKRLLDEGASGLLDETAIVQSIRLHAEKDWRAGAWLLERSNPAKWGPRSEPLSIVRPADLDSLITGAVHEAIALIRN